MSSFKINAKHKSTGIIHEVWCIDDYFGKNKYGYCPNIEGGYHLTEEQFYREYEEKDNEERIRSR